MNTFSKLATSSFLALTVSAGAFAQSSENTAIAQVNQKNEAIDDAQKAVADDLAKGKDDARYGSVNFAQGWSGSFSLGYSGANNNSPEALSKSEQNLNLSGRFKYGSGKWNHTLGLSATFNDANKFVVEKDKDGKEVRTDKTENASTASAYATYDVNRSFTDRLYGYGLLSADFDGASLKDGVSGVASVGIGYRIVNQPNFAWRVQAGPAYLYNLGQADEKVTIDGVETINKVDLETSEAGVGAASRLFYKITDNVSLTNDTELSASKGLMNVSNDFGINFKVSDNISTRFGYRTKFSERKKVDDFLAQDGFADNTVSLSVVYGF